jgi:hypothetical protein
MLSSNGLRAFENQMLRRIFGPNRKDVTKRGENTSKPGAS